MFFSDLDAPQEIQYGQLCHFSKACPFSITEIRDAGFIHSFLLCFFFRSSFSVIFCVCFCCFFPPTLLPESASCAKRQKAKLPWCICVIIICTHTHLHSCRQELFFSPPHTLFSLLPQFSRVFQQPPSLPDLPQRVVHSKHTHTHAHLYR